MFPTPPCYSAPQADSERALRAVHSRFYLSDVPIGVGIVGPGLIGGTLVKQVRGPGVGGRGEVW